MNILVVEDSPVCQRLLRTVLEAEGFVVHAAENGVEALKILEREPLDLLITDVLMPRMDGYQLCREVRRNERFKNLPIVVHTAVFDSPEDEQMALNHGADRILNKPAPPHVVVSFVRETLRGHRPPAANSELELLREHNERLTEKLLERNAELETQKRILRASEARLRAIVELEPEAILTISPEGWLIEMNPAGLPLLEAASLLEVQHKPLVEFVAPEFRAEFGRMHGQALAGGTARLEHEIFGLKGTLRRVETRASALRNATGDVEAVLAITRDITGQWQAEKQLRQSEAFNRSVLESALDAIMVVDQEGRIVEFNAAAEGTFGHAQHEVLGQELTRLLVPPPVLALSERGAARLLVAQFSELPGRRREMTARRKGGAEFPVVLTLTPMATAGAPLYTVFIRDISGWKKAVTSARQQEDRFNKTFDASPVAIVISTAAEGRYVDVNAHFLKTFGFRKDEVIGHTALELGVWARPEQRGGIIQALRDGRSVRDVECQYRTKDGRLLQALVSVEHLELDDEPCLLWINHDISVRKKAEQELAEERNLLRTLIDNLPSQIFVKDGEGRYLVSNRAHSLMAGVDHESQLAGKTAFDFFPPEVAQAFDEDDQQLLRSGQPVVSREEPRELAGDKSWVLINKVPLLDAHGQVNGLIGIRQDITPQKRAEFALAKERNLLRKLLDSLPGLIYVKDTEGRYLVTNRANARLLGVQSPEAVLGKTVRDFFPPEIAAAFEEDDRVVIATGEPVEEREERFMVAGRSGWFTTTKVPLHDEQGGLIGLLGITTEITDRKVTELHKTALTNLGQKLSSTRTAKEAGFVIVEAADQLFGWDCCTLDMYSARTKQIHRVLVMDLLDGRRTEFPPAMEGTALTARTRDVIENGASLILRDLPVSLPTDTVPFGDKSRPSASIMTVPVRDGTEVIAILSIQSYRPRAYTQQDLEVFQGMADHCGSALTRIKSSEALRESEERFRELAENINEAFWMTDPAKLQMLYISPAYEKIWGRSCQSLYESAQSWLEAIHPEDRARVLEAAMTRQTAGTYDEKYRITRPDGSTRWIHDRAFPIRNAQGEVYRVVGTAEDITQQRNLESQLRQSQKMEAIGTLAGGIAHDFNNILGAINGFTELARLDAAGHASLEDYLNEIHKAGLRATDLVRQILTFSRQHDQPRRQVHLPPVVSEAFRLLRATIPTTIEFQLSLAPDIPPVLADATQVHQIIMNLGTNAHHAMRDKPGRLQINLAAIDVNADMAIVNPSLRAGRYVKLSVTDTGHGIDRAMLDRIFEPFFTTKGPGEGTGLGLAVVHGIMQAHEGAITVYSQPGQGTTFHLYFPVANGLTGGRAVSETEVPAGSGQRILFVDDEAALIKVGQRLLERLGYQVEIQTDPAAALAAVRANPQAYDLVITDLTMPLMTGTKLAQEILAIRPGLPIILATGYAADLTFDDVRALGIRELVLKPMTRQTIGEAVARELRISSMG